jgi:hypothetical protein
VCGCKGNCENWFNTAGKYLCHLLSSQF